GTSLHARCGFRLSEKPTPLAPSSLPAAKRTGMRSPLTQLSLQSFIVCLLFGPSNAPDDLVAFGDRPLHHLDQRPGTLAQAHGVARRELLALGRSLLLGLLTGRLVVGDRALDRSDRTRHVGHFEDAL